MENFHSRSLTPDEKLDLDAQLEQAEGIEDYYRSDEYDEEEGTADD